MFVKARRPPLIRSPAHAVAILEAVRAERARRALEDEREELENDFGAFVEAAWPSIDPAPYSRGWVIDAMVEHLEAVVAGQIRKLLINVPPRASKTSLCSILLPAWIWARRHDQYLSGPGTKFLCGSYGYGLSTQTSMACRRLIASPWFHERWGRDVVITSDQDSKLRFDTTAGGSRIACSVGGSLLGLGFDLGVVDDPHDVSGIESAADRESVLTWFKEFSTTRMNRPQESAIVVVMQRLAELDVSGHIMTNDKAGEWDTLMVPMEFEAGRIGATRLGWLDPRAKTDTGEPLVTIPDRVPVDDRAARILNDRENTLMWPERFDRASVDTWKRDLGPYLSSGRLQQSPTVKGGGIFRRSWWQLWAPPDGNFPVFDYVVAALDPAFLEKESNDPSALVVMGVFSLAQDINAESRGGHFDENSGMVWHQPSVQSRIMLCAAWEKRLPFSGPRIERLEHEVVLPGMDPPLAKVRNARYRARCLPHYGLVEHVRDTCLRFKVHTLLIESAASGISAAQELRSRYGNEGFSIQLVQAKGDKVARALAAQATFAQNLVYAPDRDWAEAVILQMEGFPKASRDDLTDACVYAINHLRAHGLAKTDVEAAGSEIADLQEEARRMRQTALYPV